MDPQVNQYFVAKIKHHMLKAFVVLFTQLTLHIFFVFLECPCFYFLLTALIRWQQLAQALAISSFLCTLLLIAKSYFSIFPTS